VGYPSKGNTGSPHKKVGSFSRANSVLICVIYEISGSYLESRVKGSTLQSSKVGSISLSVSEWLRIAFAQFLSSEARALMGIKDVGEWKGYAIQRFKGILDLTLKSSLQTRSPIPAWAAEKVKEAWNVH
jgi:hypothetical protein